MPEVHKYKNTGLEYVEGKGRFMIRQKGEKSGVLVTQEEFKDWDSRNILFAQVLGIKNDKDRGGFDFDYAARTGKAHSLGATVKPETTVDDSTKLAEVAEPSSSVPLTNPHPENEETVITKHELGRADPIDEPATFGMSSAADTVTVEALIETGFPAPNAEELAKVINEYVEKHLKEHLEKIIPVGKQKKKKGSIISIHTSRNVMMGILIIVGLLSLVMSTYHIIAYLYQPRGPFVAVVSALAMTLFSSSAFTAGRYFWFLSMNPLMAKEALKNGLIAWAFWIMGIGIVIYAMFATMDVNFTDFRNRQQAVTTVAVAGDSGVKAANQKDEDLRTEAKRLDGVIKKADDQEAPWIAEIQRLTRALSVAGLTDDQIKDLRQARDTAQYRYNVIENAVKPDRKKRSDIGDKLLGTGDSTVTAENVVKAAAEKGTFFSLLNDISGWDIETLKLIVYIIPAVFYDLMSPFALTVVMILEEKREEDDNKALPD